MRNRKKDALPIDSSAFPNDGERSRMLLEIIGQLNTHEAESVAERDANASFAEHRHLLDRSSRKHRVA